MSYQSFDAQRCNIRPNATPIGGWLLAGAIARLCLCVVGGRVCAVDSHKSRLYLRYALRRCIALLVRCVALCGCVCVVNRTALICGLLGLACLRWIGTCFRSYCVCARSNNTVYVGCMFALKSFCDVVWFEFRIVSVLIAGDHMF